MRSLSRIGILPAALCITASVFPLCIQRPLAIDDDFQKAEAVFAGEVQRVEQSRVTFAVKTSWKGAPSQGTLVVRSIDSPERPPFEPGKSYLVFAIRSGEELTIEKCSRTRLVADAHEDLRQLQPRICRYDVALDKWTKVEGHELPTALGLYWMTSPAGSRMAVIGPVSCNDLAIGVPPRRKIAACVPSERHATAMFVPDPKIHCSHRER